MRVAVLADIGQPVYHVGDEAIGHAVQAELRGRGLEPIMLTRDVEHTRHHFGDVESARTIPFPWGPVDRARYLAQIESYLGGASQALPPGDPAIEVIESLRTCHGLVLAGGGNLNSRFGWLLYERAALAAIADRLRLPVVVSGQTLGPVLTQADRSVATQLLRRACLVGLRDARSVDLAVGMTPEARHIVPVLDDATFFTRSWPPTSAPAEEVTTVSATFTLDTGPIPRERVIPRVAALLDEAARLVDGRVEFVPHMATPGANDGDEEMHRRIADHMTSSGAVLHPIETAVQAATRTRQSQIVVTTRFHPAVFAASAGAALLLLAPDDYTASRMAGLVVRWSLSPLHVLPLSCVEDGEALSAVAAALEARDRLRAAHPGLVQRHGEFSRQWWDAVVAVLRSETPTVPTLGSPDTAPPAEILTEISRRHAWYLPLTRMLEEAHQELQLSQAREEAVRRERDQILGTRAFRTAQAVWATRLRWTRRRPRTP